MGLHLHLNHEITRGSSETCISLFRHSQIDAIVDSLWNVDSLLHGLMSNTLASTGGAWVPNHCSYAIAVAADLLYHEGALSDSLEASTATCSALALSCARFGLGSLACATDICSSELNSLLSSVDRLHKVNLHHNYDVFAFHLRLSSSTPLLLISEEFLELFEYVSKWVSLLAPLPKLVMESFEAGETSKTALAEAAAEWILLGLLLLIARHARSVIDPLFLLVA
jgi:hypothetical protein